jgi:hypothetical protein
MNHSHIAGVAYGAVRELRRQSKDFSLRSYSSLHFRDRKQLQVMAWNIIFREKLENPFPLSPLEKKLFRVIVRSLEPHFKL